MEIKIRGEKLKITDAMRSYVDEKIGKLDKYLEIVKMFTQTL